MLYHAGPSFAECPPESRCQSDLSTFNLKSGVIYLFFYFFASLLLWLEREKITPDTFIFNVCLVCHVISQSAFTRRESNFGGNNVSFEMTFRDEKIFKYVQMALPKKKFKCFFCDEILPYRDCPVPYLYLTATNNKEFTGKSSLT